MEKVKNVFWLVIIIFILVLSYSVFKYVDTYSKSIKPDTYKSFAVTAEGKASGIPDVAEFSFSIISQGKDLAEIQKENTEKANNAIKFLKEKGIDEKDIKTVNYDINPQYTYYNCSEPVVLSAPLNTAPVNKSSSPRPCPPPTISGYKITQTINVKIRDFSKIGEILSGIVQFGANDVSGLSFKIDDETKLENEAKEKAILNAKEKAKKIAEVAGFKLGKLLSIEESNGNIPYRTYEAKTFGVGGGTSALSIPAPEIQPGSSEISVSVTLRYEIE